MMQIYSFTNNKSICAHVFPKIKMMLDNACMNKRDIKDVLGELMQKEGIKQVKLEDLSGVPQPTISRILRGGHQTLELATARKLANYFKVSLDQMVGAEPLKDDARWHQVKTLWGGLSEDNRELIATMMKQMTVAIEKRKEVEAIDKDRPPLENNKKNDQFREFKAPGLLRPGNVIRSGAKKLPKEGRK